MLKDSPLAIFSLGHSAVRIVNGGALLSRHATFGLPQLALTCQ